MVAAAFVVWHFLMRFRSGNYKHPCRILGHGTLAGWVPTISCHMVPFLGPLVI
jgi:hypothetical protein